MASFNVDATSADDVANTWLDFWALLRAIAPALRTAPVVPNAISKAAPLAQVVLRRLMCSTDCNVVLITTRPCSLVSSFRFGVVGNLFYQFEQFLERAVEVR
jgi:hypothetical protein